MDIELIGCAIISSRCELICVSEDSIYPSMEFNSIENVEFWLRKIDWPRRFSLKRGNLIRTTSDACISCVTEFRRLGIRTYARIAISSFPSRESKGRVSSGPVKFLWELYAPFYRNYYYCSYYTICTRR